ncbi:MAG: EamA family transporter [Rhizobiaceae bacterium]
MTLKPVHALLALFVTAIWGFNFVVIKVGVAEVPPLLLTGLRFLFAALPAIFFVPKPKAAWQYVAAFGFLLGVVKFGMLFVSIKIGLSASLASLVMQLQVFFTIVFAAVLLGERSKPIQIIGGIIAFAGIGIIAASRWNGPDLWPLLLAVLAALTWGVANIVSKKSGETNVLSFIVWASLAAPVPLFLLSYLFEDHALIRATLLEPSWLTIATIAFLAWPATVFAFGSWNFLLGRYPANMVTPFALLVPIFGIASGIVFLGEPFDRFEIAGSMLVLAGLLLNMFGARLLKPAQHRST